MTIKINPLYLKTTPSLPDIFLAVLAPPDSELAIV